MINTNYKANLINKVWNTAIYIRLSREDGDKAESNSVASQREILKEYLRQNPELHLIDIYVDDGFSGTNFDRPDFCRMIEDIYSYKINCVVVKDLSRFGRNYVQMGHYLDDVFVRLGVRFIALNNSHDTFYNSGNVVGQLMQIGMTNVMNESFAASTSVNVRGTLNLCRKQGKFIGSFATYGYIKDPADRHKLIVDETAASVVRKIFGLYSSGMTILGISRHLNELGVLNPSSYKKSQGMNYKHPACDGGTLWTDSSVRRILQNRMYIGDMVQGKNTTLSYKIKQCKAIPKDEWIIVEGTHEAIIEKDEFYLVQDILAKNVHSGSKSKKTDLFSGLVKCACCGRMMNKKTNIHPYGEYNYYRCVTNKRTGSSLCKSPSIRIDKLEKTVLSIIQQMIKCSVETEKVIEKINEQLSDKSNGKYTKNAISSYESELEKAVVMSADLYPDWKSGVISKEEYFVLKTKINDKIDMLKSRILELKSKKTTDDIKNNEFLNLFKKYGNIKKLTRAMLVELVDSILVYNTDRIEINFRFKDSYIEISDFIEENNGIA